MINKLSIRKLRLLGCACWRLIFPFMTDLPKDELLKWKGVCSYIENYENIISNPFISRTHELKDKPVDLYDLSLVLMTSNRTLLIQGILSFFSVTTKHKDVQADFIQDIIGEEIIYSNCSLCHGTGYVQIPEPSYKISMIPSTESCWACRGTGQFELSFMYDNLMNHYQFHQIKALVQQAYNNLPDTDGLLILSDALEEVKAPVNLLNHIRSNKPHIKGCSVLDLILGNR